MHSQVGNDIIAFGVGSDIKLLRLLVSCREVVGTHLCSVTQEIPSFILEDLNVAKLDDPFSLLALLACKNRLDGSRDETWRGRRALHRVSLARTSNTIADNGRILLSDQILDVTYDASVDLFKHRKNRLEDLFLRA